MPSMRTILTPLILAGAFGATPLIASADNGAKADAASFAAGSSASGFDLQSEAAAEATGGKYHFNFRLDDDHHHHGFGGGDDHHHNVPSVPEPGTAVLFGAGILALGAIARRTRRRDR